MKRLLTTTAITFALTLPMYAANTTEADKGAMENTTDAITETANDAAEAIENTAEDAADAAGSMAEDAADATESTYKDAADATDSAAQDAAQATESTYKDAADATESAVDEVAEGTADAADTAGDTVRSTMDDTAEGSPRAPMEGYEMVPAAEVTAAQLEGARVYDGKEKWIGEVSKIIMDADGKVDTLVVDVGGFLGIGEKPVGLDFTAFDLQKSQDGDEIRASVQATKDELETMPEYDG